MSVCLGVGGCALRSYPTFCGSVICERRRTRWHVGKASVHVSRVSSCFFFLPVMKNEPSLIGFEPS